jgi:UDP-glucose 4-epimerase
MSWRKTYKGVARVLLAARRVRSKVKVDAMRVLVTGAFGFVGTAVVRRLALVGHDVAVLTHRPSDAPVPTSRAREVIHADICDASAIRVAVSGVDAVCHLAARSLVRESFERPAEYQQVNAVGTRTIVNALTSKAMEGGEPVSFVHASTHAVYGTPERQPVAEDTPLAPVSPYGQSKAEAESALSAAAGLGAFNAVCLRLFNVAGAVDGRTDTEQSRIIPKTLAVAAGRAPVLEINGDGGAIRDFVHVEDVADAFLLALDACHHGTYAVYNVGATAASMLDVITVTEQITGRAVPVVHNPPRPEPRVMTADTTRISHDLSWAPERSSLDKIIADAWEVVNA